MTIESPYILSLTDVDAICRLIIAGGKNARISMDSVNFEVGILSETGYLPVAYGSGDTIADAVDEALGKQHE